MEEVEDGFQNFKMLISVPTLDSQYRHFKMLIGVPISALQTMATVGGCKMVAKKAAPRVHSPPPLLSYRQRRGGSKVILNVHSCCFIIAEKRLSDILQKSR